MLLAAAVFADQDSAARAHGDVVRSVQRFCLCRLVHEYELTIHARRRLISPDLTEARVPARCRREEDTAVSVPASFEPPEPGGALREALVEDRGRCRFGVSRIRVRDVEPRDGQWQVANHRL